ncbi:MAG: hypothetical protein ACFFBD_07370 [Candidatus Hodarchaeota archaeon]
MVHTNSIHRFFGIMCILLLTLPLVCLNLPIPCQRDLTSSATASQSSLSKYMDSENEVFPVGSEPTFWPVKENNRVKVGFGGFMDSLVVNWKLLTESIGELSIMAPTGSTQRAQFEWLASRGVNLTATIFPFRSDYNMLDLYYNSSYQQEVFSFVGRELNFSWVDLVYKIRLGDEEPLSSFNWLSGLGSDNWPEAISKYNSTYFSETNHYFKNTANMNLTEQRIFNSWLDNRSVSGMNILGQYFRTHYPDKVVDWGTLPILGQTLANLDVDERGLAIFTSDPLEVYSQVRNYKSMFPNEPLTTVLWGDLDPVADEPTNYLKDFELLSAAAVAAGSEKVSWFTDDWLNPNKASQDHFEDLLEITRKLSKLPIFRPQPRILEINSDFGVARKGSPGLAEFDLMSQKAILEFNLDLTIYHTIIVRDQYYLYEDVVQRLNQYVEQGGNLILIGNTGLTLQNEWGLNRSSFLPIEAQNVSYKGYNGDILTINNINNPLEFSYQNIESPSYNAINFTSSSDYQTIPTGLPGETEGYYPLVLYRNSSSQGGWILYSGFSVTKDEGLWYKLLKRFLELKVQTTDGITITDQQTLWHGIGTFGLVDQTNQEQISSWVINLENSKQTITIQANFTERNWDHPVDWYYGNIDGLDNDMLWWGTNTPVNGQTQLSRRVSAESVEHFLFSSIHPGPSLTVDVIEPVQQPIVGEPFFFILKITNELQFEDISNLTLQLSVPTGIQILSLPNSPINIQLAGKDAYTALWELNSTVYGIQQVNLAVWVDGILYKTVAIPLKIDRGRLLMTLLEVSEINVPYSQEASFNFSIVFESKALNSLTSVNFDNIVLFMIWGNPGRVIQTQELKAYSTVEITIQEPLSNLQLGDIGIWKFSLYSTNYTEIWSELHVLLSVVLANNDTTTTTPNDYVLPSIPIENFIFGLIGGFFGVALGVVVTLLVLKKRLDVQKAPESS